MPKNVLQEESTNEGWVPEISGFRSWLSVECPKGSDNRCMVLTIDQVGQVLWLIYKMSNYMSQGVLIY